jgi:hydroxyacylglutathione hydrolase
MSLAIVTFTLGPIENNSYLLGDDQNKEAVVIDPSFESENILEEARKHDLNIKAIWLTHAHFDHIAGVSIAYKFKPVLPIYLHPEELTLYQNGGGGKRLGFQINPGPEPSVLLSHHQILNVGDHNFEVRHTPGHTPGHVIFYSSEQQLAFCGDLIFYHSVGRTDLLGGNQQTLLTSIYKEVLTLPENTILFSGHGPETTVLEEKNFNPFLK